MSHITYWPTAPAESIAKSLGRASADGNGFWRCNCPCCHVEHQRRPMLCLKDGDHGGLKIKCWKDCSRDSIERALADRGLMTYRQRRQFIEPQPINTDAEDEQRIRRIRWLADQRAEVPTATGHPG
jgi:hypothetical protein